MFTKIHVENFKSLVDVSINLLGKKKKPKQLALIYGENGSGKTNLISVFYTLRETLKTMEIREAIQDILANEGKEFENDKDFVRLLKGRFKDLDTMIKESRTIGAEGSLRMEFEFELDGKKGSYEMEFDENRIISEKLIFVLEKRRGQYFDINLQNVNLNESVFKDEEYLHDMKDKIDKFWGKHTLLSIIVNDIKEKNPDYFQDKLNPNFVSLLNFFYTFSCRINFGKRGQKQQLGLDSKILDNLLNGEIDISEAELLDTNERFLDEIFTALYADIKRVYYDKEVKGKSVKYKLCLDKIIGSKLRSIPFSAESTGTLRILDLVPSIIMAVMGSTVIIDEFDTGIHDIMVRDIIDAINDSIRGQLIFTTHNTLLLESGIEKDSIYFLTVDSAGNKEVRSLDDYEYRTQKNNNIRSLYLKGLYEGVPVSRDLDLAEIIDVLEDKEM